MDIGPILFLYHFIYEVKTCNRCICYDQNNLRPLPLRGRDRMHAGQAIVDSRGWIKATEVIMNECSYWHWRRHEIHDI